jgi:hypothetical protein
MSEIWIKWTRPGYFGRRRDEKIAALNKQHGEGNWKLAWVVDRKIEDMDAGFIEVDTKLTYTFEQACKGFYEESYLQHFKDRKDDLNFLTSFGECYDNAKTNVLSGCDYEKQEAFSTHIQDIAVRNMLRRFGLKFKGPKDLLMEIRSSSSTGIRFGPGQVPFFDPSLITQPSLKPSWANAGSVEDFWQSNKWVCVKRDSQVLTLNQESYPA